MSAGPHIPVDMLPHLMRQAFGGKAAATKSPLSLSLPAPYAQWQSMLMNGKIRLGVFALGTKTGKALKIDEPIPTPKGWCKMGDLKEGDFVFNEHGKPVRIVSATETMFDHECFEVVFSDGNSIVADAEHLWLTETYAERRNCKRCPRGDWKPKKRTTKEIYDTLQVEIRGAKRPNHSVKNVSAPVEFEEKSLPIDPYLLGVWLGDGNTNDGMLTLNAEDSPYILQRIHSAGWESHKPPSKKIGWRVVGLTSKLRELGLLKNKHVPHDYLISSPSQRLALLQGLMDTDGTIGARGISEFDNSIKAITDAVDALAVSFGIKVRRRERVGTLYGVEKKMSYGAAFATDIPVFATPRKAEKLRTPAGKTNRRTIKSVKPVSSVPVRCIQVDSDSHLFLAGKGCIPTHNSLGGASRVASFSYRMPHDQDALFRIIAPTYPLSGITFRYLHRLLPPKLQYQQGLELKQQNEAQAIWERFTPDRSESSLWMRWKHNQALIQCIHGQDPEVTIEGARSHGNVIDEASKMRQQVYSSALSTTSQTGGWNVLYSTPRGKNYFYQLYMECQEHMRWAARTGKPLEMFSATAKTTDSPYIDKKVLEQAQKTLPERLYRQLYLAEFVDDGSVFTGYRECVQGALIEPEGKIQAWTREDSQELTVVIGIDWAKRQDYCVFYAIDINAKRPRCAGFRRMQGVQYLDAVKELYRFGKMFKEVVSARHDRTGIGDVIDELLGNVPFDCEGVVFSNSSKAAMVDELSVALSTHAIELPNWPELIKELDGYDVKTNQLGKPIYGALPGQHDDIVTAVFLSWSACIEMREKNYDVLSLDDLGKEKEPIDPDTIEGWYQTLIETDGDDSHEFF